MSVIDEWKKGAVCAAWNLKSLLKNPRTYLCMTMGFLLCFLLTDRTIELSRQFVTDVQIFEPFANANRKHALDFIDYSLNGTLGIIKRLCYSALDAIPRSRCGGLDALPCI